MRCFKAYDIRGRLGDDLNAAIAQRIGRAFAEVLGARRVVLGQDCRLSSPLLADAVAAGLQSYGVTVLDLGLCGTEEVYFATDHLGADGGIMVTASHNPIEYNGMKLVGHGAIPLDPKTELARIKACAERSHSVPDRQGGARIARPDLRARYVAKVLSLIDLAQLGPLRILVNAGNGAAGPTFDAIADALDGTPLSFQRMNHAPDGNFPNGIPNPLLLENQPATSREVLRRGG